MLNIRFPLPVLGIPENLSLEENALREEALWEVSRYFDVPPEDVPQEIFLGALGEFSHILAEVQDYVQRYAPVSSVEIRTVLGAKFGRPISKRLARACGAYDESQKRIFEST